MLLPMSLAHDIIAACADDSTKLATILRKCLVLAAQLKSEDLKAWAAKELEGYERDDEVPRYRVLGITAKGLLLGGFGAQINDQPLPSVVLKEEHRHWATTAESRQGVASLEALVAKDPTGSARVNWPADMVVYYQEKFFEGYALNRAWQEIPIPAIVEILDTVRTRVLKFMLELQDELGDIDAVLRSQKVDDVAPVVQNIFQTTVYGGTAFVASEANDVDARTQTVILKGDFKALADALRERGLEEEDIGHLESALAVDEDSGPLRQKRHVMKWIMRAARKVASATSGVAIDVAKAWLTSVVSSYLGIPPPTK